MLFLNVLFWAVTGIWTVCGLIYCVAQFGLFFIDNEGPLWDFEKSLNSKWASRDMTDAAVVAKFEPLWSRQSGLMAILLGAGITLMWLFVTAFLLQCASWIYGWGL